MSRVQQIQGLQEVMESLPQEDLKVVNHFAPGVYIRELFIPKGVVIIGKIHSTEHFNIVIKGRCRVATAEGVDEREAGDTFVSCAGIQKVIYALEDCVWQTVHATEKTDLDEIESDIISESYNSLPEEIQMNLGVIL